MFQPKKQLNFQLILSRLILLLPCLSPGLLEADERPNFIVIIGDDISWNDYGAYGHPNIQPRMLTNWLSRVCGLILRF